MTEWLNILYGLWAVQDQVMDATHVGLQIMIGGVIYILFIPALPRETP